MVLLLALGWLAQQPVLHQIHLAFDDVVHVWCPLHHRLEHFGAHRHGPHRRPAERPASRAVDGQPATGEHQACPLSSLHESCALGLPAPAGQARLPDGQVVGRLATASFADDVLRYAPKLSPPCAS